MSPERAKQAFEELFPGMALHLVGSGTQALALAIRACRAARAAQTAEVIVPAYGCPDLVAACIFAGATPRLVDVAYDDWGYDQAQLERNISGQTVAVLAVNLLGIGDDAAELQRFTAARGIALIADSAQHVPMGASTGPQELRAQYTVLSFGRGKPANALRGGLLIAADAQDAAPVTGLRARLKEFAMSSRLAALAFNLATHPYLYSYTSRLPGLGVGTTTYKPLTAINALPASAWQQVGAALIRYNAGPADNLRIWRQCFGEWSRHGVNVLQTTAGPAGGRHLRLPLLARDKNHRNHLVDALQQQGCGATRFYGAPLQQIDAVPEVVARQGPFPNASRLADRLLTLPTHRHVTEAIARRVSAVIRASGRV